MSKGGDKQQMWILPIYFNSFLIILMCNIIKIHNNYFVARFISNCEPFLPPPLFFFLMDEMFTVLLLNLQDAVWSKMIVTDAEITVCTGLNGKHKQNSKFKGFNRVNCWKQQEKPKVNIESFTFWFHDFPWKCVSGSVGETQENAITN